MSAPQSGILTVSVHLVKEPETARYALACTWVSVFLTESARLDKHKQPSIQWDATGPLRGMGIAC